MSLESLLSIFKRPPLLSTLATALPQLPQSRRLPHAASPERKARRALVRKLGRRQALKRIKHNRRRGASW